MSRRKPSFVLGLLAVSSLALGACGSSELPGGSSSASATESSSTVEADPELVKALPPAIAEAGKIVVGTDATYAPNEFLGDDGKTVQGMDIDVFNAVAAQFGVEVEYQPAAFDSIILGVNSGKYNVGVSSFTINDERKQQVNMISYFSAGTGWAVQTGNPAGVSIDDACGKTVAVQKATVQVDDIEKRSEDCKSAGKPEINIQQYGLQSEATTAVVSGKADAMLADSPVVAYAIQQSGKLEPVGEVYDSAPYGIVVPKEETEFATAIQGAVDALIADGTYGAILEEWGVSNGAVTAAEVNPSS